MRRLALAVDVGGTFTDVVMIDPAERGLWTTKAASVPRDPAIGFFDGIDKILGEAGRAAEDIGRVFHGSTIATNAILEGKGARTGMVVSEGFKYVLEIGRAEIPRKVNLFGWVKPKRPVPPRLIEEVRERVLVDGSVQIPLDEDGVRAAARKLRSWDVEAIAVVFLHAYAAPGHERRAAEILAEELPDVAISISSDVMPVFREYERSMATALNAYVRPLVGRYVEKVSEGLAHRRIEAPLLIMSSGGGVFSPEQAAKRSIEMALSGPAAGAQGAADLARRAGFENAITIDMGGTSADVSLIRDGAPRTTKDGRIGDFPLALPIVDIHTIGAGGGSIAQVTPEGGLMVGPASAGADPGPACYGKGGEWPTVTDANLVLGRIPAHLLDGQISLDPAKALRAVRTHVAEPLGIGVAEAARGIVEIVNNNMVGALRVVSIERGYDPKDFALIAFGGAGPMHGGALARLLGSRTMIVPRHPGILCAIGLLTTDLVAELAQTFIQRGIQRGDQDDLEGIGRVFARLEADADRLLASEGVEPLRRRLARAADLRYAHQGVEVTVDLPEGPLTTASLDALQGRFHATHERLYTFNDISAPVEIVTLRVRAVGIIDRIELPELPRATQRLSPAASRRVDFGDGMIEVAVFRREQLHAGHTLEGPAIVDQLDTTTVLFPGQTARVDPIGNLIVSL